MEKICRNCLHGRWSGDYNVKCVYNAPFVHPETGRALFPIVGNGDFCFKFKGKR